MHRSLGIPLLLASLAAAPAQAAKKEYPYMWGIGPKIGTIIVPGHYPIAFPSKIVQYDFIEEGELAGDEESEEPKRDLDSSGDPRFSTLERVRDDLQLGLDGFYGIDKQNRIGAGVGAGFGRRYLDMFFTLNYDRVLVHELPFNVVAGGQVGYGSMRFKGADPVESLRMPYFPLRARLQGQFLDKVRMYALELYGQTAVPSNTFYTDLDGALQPTVGSPLNFALNLSLGVELQILFGDFTPPKKKKKKKGGGGGNNSGGNNNGGGNNSGGGAKKDVGGGRAGGSGTKKDIGGGRAGGGNGGSRGR